jgi:hypothetical protein
VLLLSLASVAGIAVAAEPTRKATEIEAPAPKPDADGWYQATPIDASFVVQIPALFQAFSEEGKTESGAVTRTVGVRGKARAAFGGVTSYIATCVEQEGDERDQNDRLRAVINRWTDRGILRFQRQLETGPIPGYEFEIADDVKVMRSRIYAPKTGTCTVLISWRPFAKPSDADIARYLDSFQFSER